MSLRLRPTPRSLTHPPPLTHLFSSSSSSSDPSDPPEPKPKPDSDSSSSSLSNYFNDVKASLRRQPTTTTTTPPPPPPSGPSASLAEIRKNLAGFRARSTDSKPSEPPPPPGHISFQELYKRNVSSGKVVEFKSIRDSLRLKPVGGDTENKGDALSYRLSNMGSKGVGKEGLPPGLFDRDREREREKGMGEKMEGRLKTEFVKIYSYEELGNRLRKLRRDEEEGKEEFSLGELSERLMKLREMEVSENQQRSGGMSYEELRLSLVNLKLNEQEKAKKDTSE